MLLKDFLPHPSVQEFVRCYRIVHLHFDAKDSIPTKAYPPKPETVLSFFLKGQFAIQWKNGTKVNQPSVILIGQRTAITTQYTGHELLNFQIVFQPTALFRLTGIPNYELTDKCVDAEFVFAQKSKPVFELLQCAKSYEELLLTGENFVRTLINKARNNFHCLDTVATQMLYNDSNVAMDWLAKEACLCTKQFERNFHERVGVNPKLFARIIRFNKAYNIKNKYPGNDWLRIAIECGYYDYQHLAKDYKEFTGVTPNEFDFLESKSPERTLGLADTLYQTRI